MSYVKWCLSTRIPAYVLRQLHHIFNFLRKKGVDQGRRLLQKAAFDEKL